MNIPILAMEVHFDQDVVFARQRARQIAELLGFSSHDQTRIATAVSETTRGVFQDAGSGRVEFLVENNTVPQKFLIQIQHRGTARSPGARSYPETGLEAGIASARRLVDHFAITPGPGQDRMVSLAKELPPGAPVMTGEKAAWIRAELARLMPESPVEELRRQNQELLRVMEELRRRQEELTRLNQELEDTNRGVLALYAELQDRAEQLKQADGLKSQFLSYMSHEFRTPLSSILSLSHILLERMDGELAPEQEKQVAFIKEAAQGLADLSNDLLNLARIEAGKISVHPARFEVSQLFSTLRGMMKPLANKPQVSLVFADPAGLPPLCTDEGKIAQILRNFIANALKFTERGEVCVAARLEEGGRAIAFSVTDTGIGIAPEDQKHIFDEFEQIQTSLHRESEGTGLGLPLSRRLAGLLGGSLSVESEAGVGSTFTATIPLVYAGPDQVRPGSEPPPVLAVEDDAGAVR